MLFNSSESQKFVLFCAFPFLRLLPSFIMINWQVAESSNYTIRYFNDKYYAFNYWSAIGLEIMFLSDVTFSVPRCLNQTNLFCKMRFLSQLIFKWALTCFWHPEWRWEKGRTHRAAHLVQWSWLGAGGNRGIKERLKGRNIKEGGKHTFSSQWSLAGFGWNPPHTGGKESYMVRPFSWPEILFSCLGLLFTFETNSCYLFCATHSPPLPPSPPAASSVTPQHSTDVYPCLCSLTLKATKTDCEKREEAHHVLVL